VGRDESSRTVKLLTVTWDGLRELSSFLVTLKFSLISKAGLIYHISYTMVRIHARTHDINENIMRKT